jgi:tight adherence protein C
VIPAIPAFIALVAYCLAIVGVSLVRDRGLVGRFDAELAVEGPKRPGPVSRLGGVIGRRIGPLLTDRLDDEGRRKLRRRIDSAGRPGGMTVETYGQKKAVAIVLGAIGAVLFLIVGRWYVAIPVLALGVIWVDIRIDAGARRRQAHIERDLPDFLDILAVCVNAGIAFRPAMARVADALGGPLGEEIQTTLRQMALGASRRQAFEALRERNTSNFLGSFTSSLLQAEELGVPLADALVDLAKDIRRDAYQEARKKAQKVTPRVSLVVTTIIMPGALILIVGGLIIGSNIDFGAVFSSG